MSYPKWIKKKNLSRSSRLSHSTCIVIAGLFLGWPAFAGQMLFEGGEGKKPAPAPAAKAKVEAVPAQKVSGRVPKVITSETSKADIEKVVRKVAKRHGIDPQLFVELVWQESRFKITAKSHAGAYGLAQLMPGTARYLRVNIANPIENLNGGARYLKEQKQEFGSWVLALAAYNAGPGAVRKYGGVPPYKETQNYVKIITQKAKIKRSSGDTRFAANAVDKPVVQAALIKKKKGILWY